MIISRKSVRVVTRYFENTHGKRPRGFGSWFFEMVGVKNAWDRNHTFSLSGNYGDVKKEAIRRAAEQGCHELIVLS